MSYFNEKTRENKPQATPAQARVGGTAPIAVKYKTGGGFRVLMFYRVSRYIEYPSIMYIGYGGGC